MKSIVGYDAKALYLYAIAGPFTLYKPKKSYKFRPHRHPRQIAQRDFIVFVLKNIIVTVHRVWSHLDFFICTPTKEKFFPKPAVNQVA